MQQNFNLGKVPKKFSYATWNEGDKVLKKFKQKNKKKPRDFIFNIEQTPNYRSRIWMD